MLELNEKKYHPDKMPGNDLLYAYATLSCPLFLYGEDRLREFYIIFIENEGGLPLHFRLNYYLHSHMPFNSVTNITTK